MLTPVCTVYLSKIGETTILQVEWRMILYHFCGLDDEPMVIVI
jgi:hypothetical protein